MVDVKRACESERVRQEELVLSEAKAQERSGDRMTTYRGKGVKREVLDGIWQRRRAGHRCTSN